MDVEKLKIKDGDILLVSNYTSEQEVHHLVKSLKELGRKNVLFIVGMSVKVLSEKEMKKYGWEKKRRSGSKKPA